MDHSAAKQGNLIASLLPHEDTKGWAIEAVRLLSNSSRFVPGTNHCERYDYDREQTPAVSLDAEDDSLQLTFAGLPKKGPRFVFGANPNICDVVLPAIEGVSHQHCYLTFDDRRNLVLGNLSAFGTAVKIHNREGLLQGGSTWVVAGPQTLNRLGGVVIRPRRNLQFKIQVPQRTKEYNQMVDDFLLSTRQSASLPLGALNIQSNASTQAPSHPHTPNAPEDVFELETLGKGARAIVTLVYKPFLGVFYVRKDLRRPRASEMWKKEVEKMRSINHYRLVRLHDIHENPYPQLFMDYVPCGDLTNLHFRQRKFCSNGDVINILVQSLEALAYLHAQNPPVVHRNIKPGNILLQSYNPISIKLTDFGITTASNDLQIQLSARTYCAPEVFERVCAKAMDIWSLSVVVYQLLLCMQPLRCDLPHLHWCYTIRNWFLKTIARESPEHEPYRGLTKLLERMICINPNERISAEDCLEAASRLDDTDGTPIPAVTDRGTSPFSATNALPGQPATVSDDDELYTTPRPGKRQCTQDDHLERRRQRTNIETTAEHVLETIERNYEGCDLSVQASASPSSDSTYHTESYSESAAEEFESMPDDDEYQDTNAAEESDSMPDDDYQDTDAAKEFDSMPEHGYQDYQPVARRTRGAAGRDRDTVQSKT